MFGASVRPVMLPYLRTKVLWLCNCKTPYEYCVVAILQLHGGAHYSCCLEHSRNSLVWCALIEQKYSSEMC